ncbi:MAG TPA: hypothetical protein VHE53_00045 [Patescibacteria group bacterium]|nr:hypothetical protein [Patescibacteria group bacterium]
MSIEDMHPDQTDATREIYRTNVRARRAYYETTRPDLMELGKVSGAYAFLKGRYLPIMYERYGPNMRDEILAIGQDPARTQAEGESLGNDFEKHRDDVYEVDKILAASYYAVTKEDFSKTIIMLSLYEGDIRLPQEYNIDTEFWISLARIVEASEIE